MMIGNMVPSMMQLSGQMIAGKGGISEKPDDMTIIVCLGFGTLSLMAGSGFAVAVVMFTRQYVLYGDKYNTLGETIFLDCVCALFGILFLTIGVLLVAGGFRLCLQFFKHRHANKK